MRRMLEAASVERKRKLEREDEQAACCSPTKWRKQARICAEEKERRAERDFSQAGAKGFNLTASQRSEEGGRESVRLLPECEEAEDSGEVLSVGLSQVSFAQPRLSRVSPCGCLES